METDTEIEVLYHKLSIPIHAAIERKTTTGPEEGELKRKTDEQR